MPSALYIARLANGDCGCCGRRRRTKNRKTGKVLSVCVTCRKRNRAAMAKRRENGTALQ